MEEILYDDEKLLTLWNDFNQKYDELIKINIKFADLKDKMSKFTSQWLKNKETLWLNFNQQNEHFIIVQKRMAVCLDYFFKKMSVKDILSILNLTDIKKMYKIRNNLSNLWDSITSKENEVGQLRALVVDYQDSYLFFTNYYSNLKNQFNKLIGLNGEKEIKIKTTIGKMLTISEKNIHIMNENIKKYHYSINKPSSILSEVKEFLRKYYDDKNDDFIGYPFDNPLNLPTEEMMFKQLNYIFQWVTKQKNKILLHELDIKNDLGIVFNYLEKTWTEIQKLVDDFEKNVLNYLMLPFNLEYIWLSLHDSNFPWFDSKDYVNLPQEFPNQEIRKTVNILQQDINFCLKKILLIEEFLDYNLSPGLYQIESPSVSEFSDFKKKILNIKTIKALTIKKFKKWNNNWNLKIKNEHLLLGEIDKILEGYKILDEKYPKEKSSSWISEDPTFGDNKFLNQLIYDSSYLKFFRNNTEGAWWLLYRINDCLNNYFYVGDVDWQEKLIKLKEMYIEELSPKIWDKWSILRKDKIEKFTNDIYINKNRIKYYSALGVKNQFIGFRQEQITYRLKEIECQKQLINEKEQISDSENNK
ncbi:hypothetical protein [Spiroplasma eriocheiris]|uniref:Uncharacterized protein n=1 Tax=Spiroplasma eriocheiris TaxID=315358 RepID=A0A0H3XND9_9MOLU|nr:hypothetical protein [Spiroplasma eriocheiris]AHF58292.1 hypothetical protein SPE_1180 [Spiroplasma eriocheiris CCTCC M 207170]AKM54727.1 hypothetical protein SERIO_v1c11780 [Spiroplasma eriocheiris]